MNILVNILELKMKIWLPSSKSIIHCMQGVADTCSASAFWPQGIPSIGFIIFNGSNSDSTIALNYM
jgi:hypothetical protein